ncbi:hypothetical protein [Citrobacter portucalensis]|uniref:hypothetical protein n=1 Tax=Citrobacter portucalensis TaxID=1639133 RepID=UPI0013F5FA28|nr:hypothetical protein [Citrobacter portucalensis]
MIQKGSQRVGAARTGALSGPSCSCMKTTTQSGQAWRGYERAVLGLNVVFAPQCRAGMVIFWGLVVRVCAVVRRCV